MAKLVMKPYADAPEFGAWGEWSYGKDHGTYGCNVFKGMWADAGESVIGLGLQTYETSVTDKFKNEIIRWREWLRKYKRIQKKYQYDKGTTERLLGERGRV